MMDSISGGGKIIPGRNLWNVHKIFKGRFPRGRLKSRGSEKFPTFSTKTLHNARGNPGNITRKNPEVFHRLCIFHMQPFHRGWKDKRGKIPVDNWEFSTFSTEFSTRVIHKAFPQGLCKTVDIRVFPRFRLFSPFSADGKIDGFVKKRKKFGLDKVHPTGEAGLRAGNFPFLSGLGKFF